MNHSHLDSATSLCHLIGPANYRVVMFWNGMSTMHCGRWWKWQKIHTYSGMEEVAFLKIAHFESMWPNPSAISQSEMVGLSWNSMIDEASSQAPTRPDAWHRCLALLRLHRCLLTWGFGGFQTKRGGGSWGVGELRQETELLRSRFWRRSKFRVFVAKPTDLTGKDPFVEACGCLHHQIPLHSLLKSKNIFAGTSTCHKPHKPYRIYRCNCRHWNNWIKILLSWWF